MTDVQMSFLDDIGLTGERTLKLREACGRNWAYSESRVRIWAMFESSLWPQYRHLWMKEEFGVGGHSMTDHWFVDYDSRGMRVSDLRGDTVYKATWKEVVQIYQDMIANGKLLTRDDERKVTEIAMQYGRPPYPRPGMMYPDCAWCENDAPIWREKEDDE